MDRTWKRRCFGYRNTRYVNVHGLDEDGHYSTARDLTLLADYAMANADFRAVVSTAHQVLPATTLHRDYTWDTTNNLLTKNDHYDGIEGVKTGHTENAGYCLVFEAAHTDRRLVGVVLGERPTPDVLPTRRRCSTGASARRRRHKRGHALERSA